MISIKKALGKDWDKIKLKDNESIYGGKSHCNETLGEFMAECNILPNEDYGELCIKLEQNGLIAIRPIAYIDQSQRKENGLKIFNFLEEW